MLTTLSSTIKTLVSCVKLHHITWRALFTRPWRVAYACTKFALEAHCDALRSGPSPGP